MSKKRKAKHAVKINQPQQTTFRYRKWHLIIPVLFAFVLYGNTLHHNYVLDDVIVILKNTHVQAGWQGLPAIFTSNLLHGVNGFNDGLYRPFFAMTFAIEHEFAGNNPDLSHFINVSLYALCGYFLFLFLLSFFKNQSLFIPFVITLLFLAHPVHTEAVANLKGRDEILAFLNFILSVYLLFKYIDYGKTRSLILSLLFFLFAMLSKESAITLAVLIPMILYFGRKEIPLKKVFQIFSLFVVLAMILVFWHAHIINSMAKPVDPGIVAPLNNSVLAAPNLAGRIATGILLQGLYLLKMLFPHPLLYDYSYNQIPATTFSNPAVIGTLLILLFLFLVFIKGIKKRQIYALGIAFYFISILITSNLVVYIGTTFAERFLFTPSLGFLLAFSVFIPKKISGRNQYLNLKTTIKIAPLTVMVILLILIGYSIKTIDRNKVWKNNFSLYQADIKRLKRSARAHYNYGTELNNQSKINLAPAKKKAFAKEAIEELKQSIAIFPEYQDARYNLGEAYKTLGLYDSAIALFRYMNKHFPDYNLAYLNLGMTYTDIKNYKQAIIPLKKYYKIYPDNFIVNYLIGDCYGHLGKYQKAEKYLLDANTLNPDNQDVLIDLGTVYGFQKKYEQSLSYLLQALKLSQTANVNLLKNIATTYNFLGQSTKAREYMQRAKAINPSIY